MSGPIKLACVILILFFVMGAISYIKEKSSPTYMSKTQKIKECNRKGAIYSDGVCQHVFAPICRRL